MTRLIPALAALLLMTTPAMAERVSVLVFDASGSMWNRVEGDLTRIEVARDVMGDYFGTRDGAIPLSVIAYGHNRRGDCADIEVVAAMGQTAPATLETRLRGLMPRGMTPLTDSLRMARDQIPPTAEAADIILVTDGLETCEGDPCALAANLAAEGIDIRAHVVGFGLSAVEIEALSCITEQTGGMLFQTNSGAELAEALQQVSMAAPEPVTEAEPEPETPALLEHRFVFSETGSGTPRGLMEWRAEAPDGTVIPFGTTEGTLESLEGLSVELPAGEWLIVAEGAEGRAERLMSLTTCCGRHGVPFTGNQLVAAIPPLGQVQAGMGARLPFEITNPGVGNLGGTPYKIIATGPEGSLSKDQILRADLLSNLAPGIQGGATGTLEPGAYRMLIVIARSDGYDIRAERSFEALETPVFGIVAPDRALPGEQVEVSFDGGYTTRDFIEVVDENDRRIGQGNALYRGAGGGGGGPMAMTLTMPNREGVFDLVVRRDGETILARRPVTISASSPEQGQDALPSVDATFRLPADAPQSDVAWQGVPLDPDMAPEAWAPMETGPAISGRFEPGRWRITATAPGEVVLSAEVDIFPGQPNDFTLRIEASDDEDHGALRLDGLWRVLGVPPRGTPPPGAPTEAMDMLRVTLATRADATGFDGFVVPTAMMGGSDSLPAMLEDGTEEDGALILRFSMPSVSPEPFVLTLSPYADGFSGTMESGANGLPVIFWSADMPLPPLDALQDQLYGPAAEDRGDLPDDSGPVIAFACAESVCSWTDPASGVTTALPQGWSVTAPEFQTASAMPSPMDLPAMSFFGPNGQELRLNPRQWIDSDGACIDTAALGRICHFADADVQTILTANLIGQFLKRDTAQAGPAMRPVSLSLAGVPRDAVYALEIVLVAGEDDRHAGGQRFVGAMSLEDYPLVTGNAYDIRATFEGRDYRDRNVTITSGADAQSVVLAPVYMSDEVSLTLPDAPILAGSGGYFPVTLAAPAGFLGSIALHDADDRDAPALFSIEGAQMLDAQDQVLPVPDAAGFYEVRFLDLNGEMFGGMEFEVMAEEGRNESAPSPEPVQTAQTCTQDGGCPVTRGRVSLVVPTGWSVTETAPPASGGEESALPSLQFMQAATGAEIWLNPSAWDAGRGPCAPSVAGPLCRANNSPAEVMLASMNLVVGLKLAAAAEPDVAGGSAPADARPATPPLPAALSPADRPQDPPLGVQQVTTGWLRLTLDNGAAPVDLFTSSQTVGQITAPADADQAVIDFMESVAGKTFHSASWTTVTGPILVGLDASTAPASTSTFSVDLDFALDPATLELVQGMRGISYTPTGSHKDSVNATALDIGIDSLRTVTDNSFAVSGRFSAAMEDGTTLSGGFVVDAVTGSRILQDLVSGK